jgi:hypothetical protein
MKVSKASRFTPFGAMIMLVPWAGDDTRGADEAGEA